MNASGRQREQGKVPCKKELCKEMKDCVNTATDPSQSAALQLWTNGRELDSTYRQCRGGGNYTISSSWRSQCGDRSLLLNPEKRESRHRTLYHEPFCCLLPSACTRTYTHTEFTPPATRQAESRWNWVSTFAAAQNWIQAQRSLKPVPILHAPCNNGLHQWWHFVASYYFTEIHYSSNLMKSRILV